VLTYQEQIAQLFVELAGMTMGTAVKVIKIISKKRSKEEIEKYRSEFVDGAKTINGIDPKVTNQLFNEVLEFAEYGFNKAHSAAYGLLAYQTAYLKANYAPEFYTAYLTSEMENHAKLALIVAEMKEHRIALLAPSVNRSEAGFAIEPVPEGPAAIRFGLAGIKGVGRAAAEALVVAARERPFTDLADLCVRVDPRQINKGTLEALIASGAFGSLSFEKVFVEHQGE
jgi:DNA polymerase-3 subunit alpha